MREGITEKAEILGHCKRILLNSKFLTMTMILIEF